MSPVPRRRVIRDREARLDPATRRLDPVTDRLPVVPVALDFLPVYEATADALLADVPRARRPRHQLGTPRL